MSTVATIIDGLPRRVLVTGGASGIGLAVAQLLADSGADVGLIGRSQDKLDRAMEILSGSTGVTAAVAADVSDDVGMRGAVDQLAARLGGLDAVVASAGTGGRLSKSADLSAAEFLEILNVNVVGAFLAVKHSLPYLVQSSSPSVTLIGSDAGFVAAPNMVAYNTSKGALVQLTRALAVELFDDHGIRVNSVCPAIVDTPMARSALGDELDDAPYPVQSADDVAWSVAYLASARSRAVNGVNLLSDFGWSGRSSLPI